MKRFKLGFYLFFAGIGLLLSVGVCFIIYIQFHNYVETNYYDTLSQVATMIEKQFPVLHDMEKLKQGAEQDEDWYWETANTFTKIAESFNLAYIYYIERVDSDYVFRMSSAISRDYQADLLGRSVWLEDTTPPEVDEAYMTQQLTFSSYPSVEEEWGILVWALLPIVNNGKTVGLLGVDYDISFIDALQKRMRVIIIVSFVFAIIIVGLLAVASSRLVLVPIEAQKKTAIEADERRVEMETLAHALRDASISKSTFLTNICNEMWTPVQAIIARTSLLLNEKNVSEKQHNNLESVNESGIMLLNIISDILEMNKIEAGQLKIVPIQYELPDLIEEITVLYAQPAAGEPVTFRLEVEETLPRHLIGDKFHIKQICHKLLNNAFEFTAKGTVLLHVSCKQDSKGAALIIRVRDTGKGITPEKAARIFSDYRQKTGYTVKHRAGGTGLGLNIAKQITEMMGGTLTVASELGKGSMFTLCVRQKTVSREQIGQAMAESLKKFKYHPSSPPPPIK